MSSFIDYWLLRGEILSSSHYSLMDSNALDVFIKDYKTLYPGDPTGKDFNRNTKTTEWDE